MIASSATIAKVKTKNPKSNSWKESWRTTAPLQRPQNCIFFFSVSCAYANLGNKTKQNNTNKESLRKAPDAGDLNLWSHNLVCVCVSVWVPLGIYIALDDADDAGIMGKFVMHPTFCNITTATSNNNSF
jgi:hypothetical protein